jgi:hypothetical protein
MSNASRRCRDAPCTAAVYNLGSRAPTTSTHARDNKQGRRDNYQRNAALVYRNEYVTRDKGVLRISPLTYKL